MFIFSLFLSESNNQALGINGTSLDISEYMKGIYQNYEIQLWASFGNSSSSIVRIHFMPYTSKLHLNFFLLNTVLIISERTPVAFLCISMLCFFHLCIFPATVGPPILSLSGCGDCLNISIDLPNRQDAYYSFYNAIDFDIHWKKVDKGRDKKVSRQLFCNSFTEKIKVPPIIQNRTPFNNHNLKYAFSVWHIVLEKDFGPALHYNITPKLMLKGVLLCTALLRSLKNYGISVELRFGLWLWPYHHQDFFPFLQPFRCWFCDVWDHCPSAWLTFFSRIFWYKVHCCLNDCKSCDYKTSPNHHPSIIMFNGWFEVFLVIRSVWFLETISLV